MAVVNRCATQGAVLSASQAASSELENWGRSEHTWCFILRFELGNGALFLAFGWRSAFGAAIPGNNDERIHPLRCRPWGSPARQLLIRVICGCEVFLGLGHAVPEKRPDESREHKTERASIMRAARVRWDCPRGHADE